MNNDVRVRGKRRGGRGQSLVEFSLIIPVFLLILSGILDAGFFLYSRMTVIAAAREGARWAVQQSDVTKIQNDGSAACALSESCGAIGTNLTGLSWGQLTLAFGCKQTHISAASTADCDFGTSSGTPDAVKGDSIIVTTTYSYQSFFARIFGSTVPIGTQVRMVLEVPED